MRAVRPRVQKKTPEQLEARKDRTKRKGQARRLTRQTGQPVRWKERQLVFVNSGQPVNTQAA